MEEMYSDFLYARPSFLEGMARVMDMGNTLNEYNTFETGEEADYTALLMDWIAVGRDMQAAMGQYELEEVSDELVATN